MDIRYTPPTSNLRRSPVAPHGSISPSRVIPISVAGRARHQSPASRRDMMSFAKARAASSSPAATATSTIKDKQTGQRENQVNVQKSDVEKAGKIKSVSQEQHQVSPIKSSTTETKSVRVVSPPMMSLSMEKEMGSEKQVSSEKGKENIYEDKVKDEEKTEFMISQSEKKILDSVSVEEIIEKVIKPAGLEAKVCSSGESKVKYHVQKTEQEDGSTKTQIVLESKVEEELDISKDSALDELFNQGLKKVSLEDIKDTATGSMIKNLLSGLQGSEGLENKSVNVEIIEEPVEFQSDEELEIEQEARSTFYEPSSRYFQIEELENVSHDTQIQRSDDDAVKTSGTDTIKDGSVQVQDLSQESKSSYFSHDQEPREYIVSTPDDDLSDQEEGGGITSYGHYGILDDLSDERYYQDDGIVPRKVIVEESDEYKFMSGGPSFIKDSFPECIIEEEVRVSPVVQESVLEFLREDSLEPKEQLKGALEKLQSSVSGPLREELAFLTKASSSEGPQNVAVKKVQQSNDNGTMTIVAELNVSQTLEDSGLLETEDELSEGQIMAALRSADPGLEKVFQGATGGGYSVKVSKEEDVTYNEEFSGFTRDGKFETEITEKHIRLGPSDKSLTFQMNTQGSHTEATLESELQSQTVEIPVKISEEKKIAMLYLDSQTDD